MKTNLELCDFFIVLERNPENFYGVSEIFPSLACLGFGKYRNDLYYIYLILLIIIEP